MIQPLSVVVLALLPLSLEGGVRYHVVDGAGQAIPAKLTVLTESGEVPRQLSVKSDNVQWAARGNVIYTLPSEAIIPLPAGMYKVVVSHGFEWSIADVLLEVPAKGNTELKATLEHVVDTRGWISADMHLHTLTFSGHGDSNVEERIITLCAENVEWAVATDHNHISDYSPHVRKLGAERWIRTTPGNEVTTTMIGHFNAFPFNPEKPPVDWKITDPRELFRRIRSEGAEVIQVNHPRSEAARGAYFREIDISPFTGDSGNREMSHAFDSFEVVNGNNLAGWVYQPEFGTGKDPKCDSSVRDDWYNFLNMGLTFTAVGNSDSHDVDSVIGGCPRNFVRSSTDDPSTVDPRELMASVRSGALSVSSGIFVEASCPRSPPGSLVVLAPAGAAGEAANEHPAEVEIAIRVQAAPWIRADRLVVVANGDEVSVTKLPQTEPRNVLRYKGTFRDRPTRDTWYVVIAIGDEAPVPVQHETAFPLGFTNAIRVDADGDGHFTPLRDQARKLVAEGLRGGTYPPQLGRESAMFRRQAVGVLGEIGVEIANGDGVVRLLSALAADDDARVRGGAMALLARRPERTALLALLGLRTAAADGAERARIDLNLARAGHFAALSDFKLVYDRARGIDRHGYRRAILELVRKTSLEGWNVAGPYPSPSWREGLLSEYPPESAGASDSIVSWRPTGRDQRGNLNFRETMDPREFAVAFARLKLEVRESLSTSILIESRNALRVFLSGTEVYRQEPRSESDASLEIVPVTLPKGDSEILLKAPVEKGVWGVVLHIVDPQCQISPRVP